MPAKISSDMPLPTPRSVICSPSHMMKALPVVRVSMVIRTKRGPGVQHEILPPLVQADQAMPNDWTALRMTVR